MSAADILTALFAGAELRAELVELLFCPLGPLFPTAPALFEVGLITMVAPGLLCGLVGPGADGSGGGGGNAPKPPGQNGGGGGAQNEAEKQAQAAANRARMVAAQGRK